MLLILRKLLYASVLCVSLIILFLMNHRHDDMELHGLPKRLVAEKPKVTLQPFTTVTGKVPKVRGKKEIIELYLKEHSERCTKRWINVTLTKPAMPLCECVPKTLVGYRKVDPRYAPFNETLVANPSVQAGGHWEPNNCTARYKVAIIIPCRGRDHHLSVLIKHLHPILQGQQLNYSIFVVDQHTPKLFNKAALMNAGYMYTSKAMEPDCVIFHDVDIIPEDGRHFYECRKNPLHLGAYSSGHSYRLKYWYIFGAVTAFRRENFQQINGFSNRFFGWGGEDDEMSYRVLRDFKQNIERDPREVAGYTTLKHIKYVGTRFNNRGSYMSKHRNVHHDGLNSLKFVTEKIEKHALYTYMSVNVLNNETKT